MASVKIKSNKTADPFHFKYLSIGSNKQRVGRKYHQVQGKKYVSYTFYISQPQCHQTLQKQKILQSSQFVCKSKIQYSLSTIEIEDKTKKSSTRNSYLEYCNKIQQFCLASTPSTAQSNYQRRGHGKSQRKQNEQGRQEAMEELQHEGRFQDYEEFWEKVHEDAWEGQGNQHRTDGN